jgi:hypothetical protein
MSTSQQAVVSGMIESWKRIFKHEIIDQLPRKVLVGGSEVLPPATATGSDIPHPLAGFEVVKAQWISSFITDSGLSILFSCLDLLNLLSFYKNTISRRESVY